MNILTKNRLMTVGVTLVALALANRVPQARQLINGDTGWF